jgi:glucose-6-phosphate isomerase
MIKLTQRASWHALKEHAQTLQSRSLNRLSELERGHFKQGIISDTSLSLDFSNQRIDATTLALLLDLAEDCQLRDKIEQLIQGKSVNTTENRPALHTALRCMTKDPILVHGVDILPEVFLTREKMRVITEEIRSGAWLGSTGKPITAIVNIGIGGSDLGPRFCIQALSPFVHQALTYSFISDADPDRFQHVVSHLNPETTLFIIASKSFTTPETLYNTKKAITWLSQLPSLERHLIAITAHTTKAHTLGFKHILPIWDWVGGRFSLCSAINLITAIAIGFDAFTSLLKGANSMDTHFQTRPFSDNLPVMQALLGIWNNNFQNIHTLLILAYAQQLEQLVPYIQQLEMESNGKSINKQGESVNYATAPIIWGGLGNQAQHSYYQLLCQGTHHITADFITVKAYEGELIDDFCLAKIQVLTQGSSSKTPSHGFIPGNIPLSIIQLDHISPWTIGALIAMYEHKTYVQSVIWDINPFDQPGVESAKRTKKISFEMA